MRRFLSNYFDLLFTLQHFCVGTSDVVYVGLGAGGTAVPVTLSKESSLLEHQVITLYACRRSLARWEIPRRRRFWHATLKIS